MCCKDGCFGGLKGSNTRYLADEIYDGNIIKNELPLATLLVVVVGFNKTILPMNGCTKMVASMSNGGMIAA